MHRAIAGFNLWALLFLLVALALGFAGARYHVMVAIFAVVFAMLAQCSIFALFMGASKLVKEHVERFGLGQELVERTNRLMIPLFRWASVGAMAVLLTGILGGLAASRDVGPWPHVISGLVTIIVVLLALGEEIPRLREMHEVLLAMEAAVPERSEGEPPPPPPDQPDDLRPRALTYVGSTVLVMVLGYRYVSGLSVPGSFFATAVGFSLACLVGAAVLHFRPRRASQ